MAKFNSLDKMSYAELARVEIQVARLKIQKQDSERAEVRQKAVAMAKAHGFELDELFGRGKVAVKYRDPKNPENTWTGRGRMPRWLAAATKGRQGQEGRFPGLSSAP